QLMSLVGPAHTRMILYTGAHITGAEAARIGLVNQVVANDQLMQVATDMARTIANNAPLSVGAARLTVRELLKDEAQRDMAAVERAVAIARDSADFREGKTAFKEKRKPRFQGR